MYDLDQLEQSLVPVVAERDALLAETALSAPEVLDAAAWEAMDDDRRRAAADRALQAVYVRKATRLGNRFDFSRLDPVWK